MIDAESIEPAREQIQRLRREIEKVIVGHRELIDDILGALLAGGHVLVEGVPGLGKTQLIKTLSDALALQFSRIQFTPDLMPADIIGTQIVMQDDTGQRHFQFQQGPVFTQLLLADEINRATPKTQSALLEAMEENRVSVGRQSHQLDAPFMVLATQNPIEMEGTYPLPEAQLDRFMLKLRAAFPNADELMQIVDRASGTQMPTIAPVLNATELIGLQALVRKIVIAEHVKQYAVQIVLASHPSEPIASSLSQRFVRHGASPRGLLSMILTAKAFALFDGRLNVSYEDLKHAAPAALRHRILLNFEGEAEGIEIEDIISEIVQSMPLPS